MTTTTQTRDSYNRRIVIGSEVKDISTGDEDGLEGIVSAISASGYRVTVDWESGQTGEIDSRDIARQG